MAVTSLWHVKGSIKDVIDYIENPEKTVPNQDMQDFFDVFSYVKNPLKTNEGEYVSAVNCLKETALQQMILTKNQHQKTGGFDFERFYIHIFEIFLEPWFGDYL